MVEVMSERELPQLFYVYIAQCRNGTFYTGYTQNVEKRINTHNAGRGGHFTYINRPLRLLAFWSFPSRTEAMRAERRIKRLSRSEKMAIILKYEG